MSTPIVALVTGSNTGIGRTTAEALAARGMRVILASRSLEKTQPVMEAIRAAGGSCEYENLDLADLDSVRACAERVRLKHQNLHLLINNAGLAGLPGLTKQGFELTFGTNHLGHFLLTQNLLPLLRKTPEARIVNVSSKAHRRAQRPDWDALRSPTRTRTGLAEYSVSKLCNVLHARALARREHSHGIVCCSLHPGVVASDAWRQVPQPFRWLIKLSMISNEQGAKTTLYCASSPQITSGAYYDACRQVNASPLAQDDELAEELWQRSVEWTSA